MVRFGVGGLQVAGIPVFLVFAAFAVFEIDQRCALRAIDSPERSARQKPGSSCPGDKKRGRLVQGRAFGSSVGK